MKEIRDFTIKSERDIVRLRNRVRLMAGTLQFGKVQATKMASHISEISRQALRLMAVVRVSVLLEENSKKYLHYYFEGDEELTFAAYSPSEIFFDTIDTITTEAGKKRTVFSKLFPDQSLEVEKSLMDTLKVNMLHLSEKELLKELERKNEELVRANKALEKSKNELLNRTQRIAKLGGWEMDLNDRSLTWTEEVYRIHEIPLDEKPTLEGVMNFYTPEVRPVIANAFKEGIENGVPWDVELSFITARGNHKWVRALGYPEVSNGKTVRLSGIFQDITEQKEAELKLASKNEELESKNKELEQFAYVASHDLQEPLRTMSSYIDLLEASGKDQLQGEALMFMKTIKVASSRMKTLITDLLDYSRVGREKTFEQVDCDNLVKTVLSDLKLSISETNAHIETGDLPTVNGSRLNLKQLFQNLISNSIKFRREDESLVIRIKAEDKEKHWVFSIEDNGIGISDKYFDRIFTIFQRLHTRQEYRGTGIGLALCKKIIDMHKGAIWLESEQGNGSTFYFSIPKEIE